MKLKMVEIFFTGGKIFSIKGVLQNILLGLKDERECALDTSVDSNKANETNESLELFYFFLDLISFVDANVSIFSDEG